MAKASESLSQNQTWCARARERLALKAQYIAFGLCLGCLALFAPFPLQGQPLEGGARAAALGAATALGGDLWGYGNPASPATLGRGGIAFFVSEGYGLEALRLGAAAAALSTRIGTLTAGARTFGYDPYRETQFHVGYGRPLRLGTARPLYAGLELRYCGLALADYGSAGALGVSLGLLVAPLESVQLGFSAGNLNAPALAEGEELPRTLALGLGYRPATGVLVLADVQKDVRHPLALRAGLEVAPVSALALRAGVAGAPARFTAGVGLRLGTATADLAAERHETLGWTPALSAELRW